MEPTFRGAFLASCVAGAGVLVAFFVWHWFTIAPVWRVLVEGAVGVPLAALAVAWAWQVSRRAGRFAGKWGGVAFGGVFAGGLLVGELVGLLQGPRPDPVMFAQILRELPAALVPVAVVALAGWRLTRRGSGAAAYALSSLVLLVYLGGVVVQRGGAGLGASLLALLAPSYLAAGVVIGALAPRFARRQC